MQVIISNELTIKDPSSALVKWVQENLIIKNPDYQKKRRMGLWTGNTPEFISLYQVDGSSLILPVGAGKHIKQFVKGADFKQDLANNTLINYQADIPLYEYQEPAVMGMVKAGWIWKDSNGNCIGCQDSTENLMDYPYSRFAKSVL